MHHEQSALAAATLRARARAGMGDARGPRGSGGSSSSPPPSSSSSSLPLESFVAPGGRGHGLRATRHLGPGVSLLRVAPLAAVPYAAHLDRVCGGCLQPCDATRQSR